MDLTATTYDGDDEAHLRRCWRLQECGRCLEQSDCSWCPFVRSNPPTNYSMPSRPPFAMILLLVPCNNVLWDAWLYSPWYFFHHLFMYSPAGPLPQHRRFHPYRIKAQLTSSTPSAVLDMCAQHGAGTHIGTGG
jgi:hypothetical protein